MKATYTKKLKIKLNDKDAGYLKSIVVKIAGKTIGFNGRDLTPDEIDFVNRLDKQINA